MAYAKNTIKLGAAQVIFSNYNIEELSIGGKVAGYSAVVHGQKIEETGLTRLCKKIVQQLERSNTVSIGRLESANFS